MPVDDPANDPEFSDVLCDINSLYNQYDDYDTIIGGEFNADVQRNNARCRLLEAWSRELGVDCPALQPGAPRRPTRYAPDGTPSLLDYVFMSEGLFQNMKGWRVLDEGDNMSDHCPIIVKLSLTLDIYSSALPVMS